MNVQLIKGGPALALVMAPSPVTGIVLAEGQWCEAIVSGGVANPPWDGPSGSVVPAVGGSDTNGSGTLSQPSAGNYTIAHALLCNSQPNSQLFMLLGGTLYGSQMFDLVDKAGPAPPRNLVVTNIY